MHLDPETLLFTGIPQHLRKEMAGVAEGIILFGDLLNYRPPWMEKWFEVYEEQHGKPPGGQLLVYSTVFPQRILLSLLKDPSSEGGIEPNREEQAETLLEKVTGVLACFIVDADSADVKEARDLREDIHDFLGEK